MKSGMFSLLCEVSKMRFGTVECDDANFYCYQIERFEQN